MADTPARSGGFNWRSPGFKEYAIVFVVALGGLWAWNHFTGASTTAATETAPSGTSAGSTPTGLSLASLMLWIQDHQSSPAPGVYFHAHPRHGEPYFSQAGHHVSEPSGDYSIGGQTYYLHADPKDRKPPYFTRNGKRAAPPSGGVT
jgi:hypothetical protein